MNPQEIKSAEIEALADCNYKYGRDPSTVDPLSVEIMRKADGSALLDHNGMVIPIRKILATKPLKRDILTRPGPGGRSLAYLSGEAVTRTLNEIFGFDGWCLEIKNTNQEGCTKDEKGRYSVAYTATVRVTHRTSGTFKEDCGAGDSVDRSLGTAVAHAMKSAVTDAMKRAARHFGDKLGNSLYEKGFGVARAPGTLQKALENYEMDQKVSKFGDNRKPMVKMEEATSFSKSPAEIPHTTTSAVPCPIPSASTLDQIHSNQEQISTPVPNPRRYSTGNVPLHNKTQAQPTSNNTFPVHQAPTTASTSSHSVQHSIAISKSTQDLSRFAAGTSPQSGKSMNSSSKQQQQYNSTIQQQSNNYKNGVTSNVPIQSSSHPPQQYGNSIQQQTNDCSNGAASNAPILNSNQHPKRYGNSTQQQSNEFGKGSTSNSPTHQNLNTDSITTPALAETTNLPTKRPHTSRGEVPEAKKTATISSRNPYGKAQSH